MIRLKTNGINVRVNFPSQEKQRERKKERERERKEDRNRERERKTGMINKSMRRERRHVSGVNCASK